MNQSLTSRQIAFLIFGALVGYGILVLPKVIAENSGTGGWLSLIFSTLIAMFFVYIIITLNCHHENKTIYEYSYLLTGKFIGKIIIFIYIVYFFTVTVAEIRITCEEIKLAILPRTPILATSLLFVLTLYYILVKGLKVIGRICVLYGVITILLILLIQFFMLGKGELINLKPFIETNKMIDYIKSTSKITLSFLGIEILVIVPLHPKNKKTALKYSIFMILFIGLLYILIFESCISVMSVEGIIRYKDALLATIRRIDIEFLQFFRRLDGTFLISWIMAIFCTISVFSYGFVFFLSKCFKKISFNKLAFISMAIVYISVQIPSTREQVELIFEDLSVLGIIVSAVIPTILLIITKVKKMLKKYKSIILLIIFSILLTGCWDFEDISRRSILLSIGVDKIENKIEFITEIASLTSLLASGKEDKTQTTNVYITSSKGKDFEEARLYLNRAIPFPLFLGATRVVIFSKNLAKEGIEPYLNRIDNIYDYRKTLLPVVSHDAPKDLYKLKIIKDISVGFLIEDIIYHLKKNGMALYPNVGEVLSNIAFGKIGFLLPYIGVNKNTIEYLGLAVFKNAKFIGVISIEKTDGILYLLSKYPTFVESIVSPDEHKNNKFSFKVKIKKRKFKTNYSKENKQIVIDVDLNLIAELRYRYYIQDFSKKYAQTLEKEISKKVKNEIKEVIEMSQKDFKCDIFSFAKYFKAQHPKIYESIDWEKNYPEIKFNINVKTKIINLGSIEKEIKKKI